MSDTRPFFVAVDLDGEGAHPAAGRSAGAGLDAQALRQAVTAADHAGFVFATFDDAPTPPTTGAAGRLEAGTRAAYASTITQNLGLAPVLHTTTTEPFHLATQLASLDHASKGRAAWLVGAAADASALATVGEPLLPEDALSTEIADVVVAARSLWDSWQDDAVIRDVASGRYLDAARVHHIDFTGATFSVKGPLITPRPPQGQVVVIAPAGLGIDEHADIVLTPSSERGRGEGPLVFVDLEVVLDAPDESAAERLSRLDAFTPWPTGDRQRYVGPAAGLADLLVSLARVADGVRLLPAVQTVDLPLIAPLVPPAPPGSTLRERLGLVRPANRYVTA
ncbi:LLM class flavin-dependent oxidoreductase [Kineosporia succinea]|uniref:Alkanesulfonate monooxygenase SsuD/methylene tetrahydromethanopterin reductase-like flavin-dependent oxidoreductase (Luciferase family) n=1 Tax=Kineosporia succinea TaxID=84632 RepID=A0ABT9P7X2_9ACTN|nr:LLM class flavin-dependent oxidoreductase [Kineosporia succinea]MDP9828773.1 alkanesulfonate monooxygenase SsuD/methylene tetrahydromethanopterin reductase-like flavin-dependent oxidoreductase (luciferase family) [Kineosporia succinea]